MDFIRNLVLFFSDEKKSENLLKIDDVTTMTLVAPFLEHGVYFFCLLVYFVGNSKNILNVYR